MKKLSLRKESLVELTPEELHVLAAGAPPRDGGTISVKSCSVCIDTFVPGGAPVAIHCDVSKESCSVCIGQTS